MPERNKNMPTCARCGGVSFSHYEVYRLHLNQWHQHNVPKKIVPEKTTDRTFDQIVEQAEATWLKKHLVS